MIIYKKRKTTIFKCLILLIQITNRITRIYMIKTVYSNYNKHPNITTPDFKINHNQLSIKIHINKYSCKTKVQLNSPIKYITFHKHSNKPSNNTIF